MKFNFFVKHIFFLVLAFSYSIAASEYNTDSHVDTDTHVIEYGPIYCPNYGSYFGINNYDVKLKLEDDGDFEVNNNTDYKILEIERQELPDDSYQLGITLLNMKNGSYKKFNTRIINDTNKGTVLNAKETKREITRYATSDSLVEMRWEWISLDINYTVTLTDSFVFNFHIKLTDTDRGSYVPKWIENLYENFKILPGDEINFLEETPSSYGKSFFYIDLKRDGQSLAWVNSGNAFTFTSMSRASKPLRSYTQGDPTKFTYIKSYSTGERGFQIYVIKDYLGNIERYYGYHIYRKRDDYYITNFDEISLTSREEQAMLAPLLLTVIANDVYYFDGPQGAKIVAFKKYYANSNYDGSLYAQGSLK